ncbi:ribbon-helix-helix domain-containing protein [uncultured Helicobacter sp.]|uniref:plasmid mobilization protein n=1 Tax=uncultured Helicobacter sp. TaxID=175537 RepID=UPI00262E41B7|nr:ribbon-helix-helix domain-containing protein [uncultured Helicobacter sp.]
MNKFESKNKEIKESEVENFISKKSANRGRKPINQEKKKTKIVSLYFSESDYQIIKEKAEKKRLSVSQYIASKVFEE